MTPVTASSEVDSDFVAAVSALEADPGLHMAWIRVATWLHDDPDASAADRAHAAKALDSAAATLGEAGQLPMAIVACLRLAERGDERQSWARLLQLGSAYGKSSPRLDPTKGVPMAMPPRAPSARTPPPSSPDEVAAGQGAAALRARAVVALRKAAAHAIADGVAGQRERLPTVPLFSALLPDAFVKLAREMSVLEAPAGWPLLSPGEIPDVLYIIARGTVRIERPDHAVLARLRAGSFFGEMALLTRTRRSAWAIAETPVVLLSAPREALEALAGREEAVAKVLAEHARRRLLQNIMWTSQMFQPLDVPARERLMSRFTIRRYDTAEVLIEDGQPATDLMVVMSGRVEVARRIAPGSEVLEGVATLGMGDVIGEMALLAKRETVALVHALEPTTVLALRKEDFAEVMEEYPAVRVALEVLVARREAEVAMFHRGTRLPQLPMPDEVELDGLEIEPLLA